MSKFSQQAKASFILEQIDRIERIVERHRGVVPALRDFEGEMAILMGISQIGESLTKIDDDLVAHFDLGEEKEGAYYTRNYIVHDYENVDLFLIEDILRNHLPLLKVKIGRLLESLEKDALDEN